MAVVAVWRGTVVTAYHDIAVDELGFIDRRLKPTSISFEN